MIVTVPGICEKPPQLVLWKELVADEHIVKLWAPTEMFGLCGPWLTDIIDCYVLEGVVSFCPTNYLLAMIREIWYSAFVKNVRYNLQVPGSDLSPTINSVG